MRIVTRVTLAFVLILFLSGCHARSRPEQHIDLGFAEGFHLDAELFSDYVVENRVEKTEYGGPLVAIAIPDRNPPGPAFIIEVHKQNPSQLDEFLVKHGIKVVVQSKNWKRYRHDFTNLIDVFQLKEDRLAFFTYGTREHDERYRKLLSQILATMQTSGFVMEQLPVR